MTEPIIINGVDVSECEYFEKCVCSCIDVRNCEGNIDILITNCEDNSDCYYKQRQRKRTECEKLINKNNLLESELNQIKLLLEGKNTQYSQLKKEYEELKAKNTNTIFEIDQNLRKLGLDNYNAMAENAKLRDKLQIATEALEDIVLNGGNMFATYRANEALERIKE